VEKASFKHFKDGTRIMDRLYTPKLVQRHSSFWEPARQRMIYSRKEQPFTAPGSPRYSSTSIYTNSLHLLSCPMDLNGVGPSFSSLKNGCILSSESAIRDAVCNCRQCQYALSGSYFTTDCLVFHKEHFLVKILYSTIEKFIVEINFSIGLKRQFFVLKAIGHS
jgi:hypothetical protein